MPRANPTRRRTAAPSGPDKPAGEADPMDALLGRLRAAPGISPGLAEWFGRLAAGRDAPPRDGAPPHPTPSPEAP